MNDISIVLSASLRAFVGTASVVFLLTTAACTSQRMTSPSPALTEASRKADVIEAYHDGIKQSVGNEVHIRSEDVVAVEKVEDKLLHSSLNLADHEQKEEVQRWIRLFSKDYRARFGRYLQRGTRYRKMIKSILKKQGVPTYVYYLAMIESGFSLHARSHAQAVGIWQFISGTGRRYGLKIDGSVDERKDPIRSTLAAAEYLNDLHNVFQSWPLAMAAYNAGEMRIVGSIMRQKSRDFWDLARRKKLPRETRQYIPKMIAAALIGNHPEKYGFTHPEGEEMEAVKAVSFPAPAKMSSISKAAGISQARLKKLNPHIKGANTPGGRHYRIWLPESVHVSSQAIASVQRIKVHRSHGRGTYRVRRGDTLHGIARKFGLSVRSIKSSNRMRSNRIYAGQKIRVSGQKLASNSSKRGGYRVRRGDSLHKISRKFGVSIGKIKRLNRLKTSRIYPGQVLRVRA